LTQAPSDLNDIVETPRRGVSTGWGGVVPSGEVPLRVGEGFVPDGGASLRESESRLRFLGTKPPRVSQLTVIDIVFPITRI